MSKKARAASVRRTAVIAAAIAALTTGALSPLAFAARSASAATVAAAPLPAPPKLPAPQPVTDDFFGTKVTDPYRYFENLTAPPVQAFFKEQNAYARTVLDRLGAARSQLFDRIKTLDNAGVSVNNVNRVGSRYFYEKLAPGEDSPKLFVRDAAPGAVPKLLVDPDRLRAAGKHFTLSYFVPSLDGRYVAYGIAEGGSENAVIHVLDTASGRVLPESIDRALFGVSSWRADGRGFYYNRLPKTGSDVPESQREQKVTAYLHVLGHNVNGDGDRAIVGYGVTPRVPMGLSDDPQIVVSPSSPYALAIIQHGVQNEQTVYAAPAAAVTDARVPWKKIVDVEDDVTSLDWRGSTAYLLTHKNAPAFKVVAVRLDRPDVAHAPTIVPPTRAVVLQPAVAADGLYVRSRDGGFGRVVRFPIAPDGSVAASTGSNVTLPYEGALDAMTTDPRVTGVTVGLTAWTRTLLYYEALPGRSPYDTKLKPPSPVDASAYTSEEVQAPSADGTMIPLSLIYRRGIALDGSHPTYLEGYGAYGITIEPGFSTTRLAWLEHNGVYAICHVRGGGWFGEDWHRAGMIATKQHTIDDFVACGRYLIDRKYTTAAHLAGEGTSAGGITIGGAITQHPETFAAALDVVGISDALRSEFSSNGPANIPEFGSVKTREGFDALYAMDAYQHVRDGTTYPAVMLVTGINDRRVPPWELAKFAARLQSASASGRPILLRVDYDAGHGFLAASRDQSESLLADEYGFLLWQLGDPAFAGVPLTYLKGSTS